MKKPEKMKQASKNSREDWYNEAIDDYEKYHNWRMRQLPSEEELYEIIRKSSLGDEQIGGVVLEIKALAKTLFIRNGKE